MPYTLFCCYVRISSMSICEDTPSPCDAKLKFQGIADGEFAERLQEEEFSNLKGDNVSSSHSRHQNVTVGSRVASKVALQEESLYKIVETERLKREEMDRTLAGRIQEREGEGAGVQTWLSRELIGFNHTKNRIQERRDESLVQRLQDEEMAAALQEREDLKLATDLQQTESSVKLARSLSRPVVSEQSSCPFARTASGSLPPPQEPPGPQLSRSRTFGAKIESPVLKQRSYPLSAGKKSNSCLQMPIPESPLRLGSVPPQGHPFLQTAADQLLFKEREETLVPAPAPPARAEPPPYSPQVPTPPVPPVPRSDPPSPESAGDSGEDTPVPPPPFVGVPTAKLKQNKRRK